jgi:hypothetical protein
MAITTDQLTSPHDALLEQLTGDAKPAIELFRAACAVHPHIDHEELQEALCDLEDSGKLEIDDSFGVRGITPGATTND